MPVEDVSEVECRDCAETKPAHQMRRDTRNGKPSTLCKGCAASRMHKYRHAPDGEEAYRNMMRRNHLAAFGLTPEQYEALLTAQGGGCAICGETCPTGRRLAVDHDHQSGYVRALLCVTCNRMLGVYENFKAQAEAYLDRYGAGNPLLPEDAGRGPIRLPRAARRGRPATVKLTEQQVREIKHRYAAGGVTQRRLAQDYRTSQINVSRIVRGEIWQDIA